MQRYNSNGKLLITGEYVVLDGAKSLALPTKFGQDLFVEENINSGLIWNSIDHKKKPWFTCQFKLPNFEIKSNNSNLEIAKILQNILVEAQKLNPAFLLTNQGFNVKTNLTFPNNWGLGSSSTLINNIAKWAKVDAYELLFKSFGGSGYDIACAENNSPIIYQIQENKPKVKTVNFDPEFKNQLYFVYLNKKQNSKNAIKKYQKIKQDKQDIVREISNLTKQLLKCSILTEFENILKEHEKIIGSILQQNPIQKELFNNYFGQTKSLGAWGGDFILATGNEETPAYFKNKGFTTVIPFQEMIL
ncbi:MAG: GHMP kinase [Flavobacteriaceae bacterium]|nr:GHMP kinase [Flavobacteriaceae bacterium]